MRLERNLAYVATAACSVPIFLWLLTFWSPSFSKSYPDWAAFGDFAGGVLSPVLAFISFLGLLVTLKQQREAATIQKIAEDDQKYFDHAVASMERAFDFISDSSRSTAPVRDRLAWLTCARLLLSASEVASKISKNSDGLRALFIGEEEHWRRKFYELFNPLGLQSIGMQATYFRQDASEYGSQIEERSIRVIYEFLQWPKGMMDPIDSVPKYTRDELAEMQVGMSGIREYVLSMPRFTAPQRDA